MEFLQALCMQKWARIYQGKTTMKDAEKEDKA
jgi:hypothetical protein